MKRNVQETQAVHCLGNGLICGYARGLDLFQVFGPHYSAPNGLSVHFASEGEWQCASTRRPETAIWSHELFCDGRAAGRLTEFADGTRPIISRFVQTAAPLRFEVTAVEVERFAYRLGEWNIPNTDKLSCAEALAYGSNEPSCDL